MDYLNEAVAAGQKELAEKVVDKLMSLKELILLADERNVKSRDMVHNTLLDINTIAAWLRDTYVSPNSGKGAAS